MTMQLLDLGPIKMVETMFKAEMLLAGLVTGLNLGERAIILVANKTDLVRFKTSMSNLSSPRARAVTGRRVEEDFLGRRPGFFFTKTTLTRKRNDEILIPRILKSERNSLQDAGGKNC